MKERPKTITEKTTSPEAFFSSAQQTKLTQSEQSDLWAELHAYAQYHRPAVAVTASQSRPRTMLARFSYWSASLAALFLIVTSTGITASHSLPGDFLYPVKTEVTEPLLGSIYFSDEKKLEYLSTIIETRLSEMAELSKINELTEAKVDILEEHMQSHSEAVINLLGEESPGTPQDPAETKESITLLSKIVSAVKTQEYLEDSVVGQNHESEIENISDNLSDLFLTELKNFSQDEPIEASFYIEEILDEIGVYIAEKQTAESENLEVQDYLSDTAYALEENNVEKALILSSEARQSLELDSRIDAVSELATE